jgi:hypothetical protein
MQARVYDEWNWLSLLFRSLAFSIVLARREDKAHSIRMLREKPKAFVFHVKTPQLNQHSGFPRQVPY